MKRHPLNLMTALSLLLFMAVAVLWVRTHWTGDSLWSARVRVDGGGTLHRRSWTVTSGAGAVDVYCVWGSTRQREFEPLFRMGRQGEYRRLTDADRAEVGRDVGGPLRLGLRWSPRDVIGYSSAAGIGRLVWAGKSWHAAVPYWLLALLTGVLPAVSAWRWRRKRRRATARMCENCGYDLRATPGRCPECGADASVTPSA